MDRRKLGKNTYTTSGWNDKAADFDKCMKKGECRHFARVIQYICEREQSTLQTSDTRNTNERALGRGPAQVMLMSTQTLTHSKLGFSD